MDKEKTFTFLFGINPVLEKLKASPEGVSELLIATGSQRPVLHKIDAEAKRLGLPVTYLPTRDLDRLAGGQRHQGILAKVHFHPYYPFADMQKSVLTLPAPLWVLILDGLTDPRNVGALLRTAEAVGIRYVVIPKDRSASVTPIVVKASAGAVHHLKICRVPNLRRAILDLKESGFWIAGLDAGGADSLYGRVYPDKLGVVLGSEGAGIRPLILKECDYVVSIPMRGEIRSLNVSAAAAVFLYELLRQKL
jgi:23S rRNA (guanosine2251-2'-O)-methyltransferase